MSRKPVTRLYTLKQIDKAMSEVLYNYISDGHSESEGRELLCHFDQVIELLEKPRQQSQKENVPKTEEEENSSLFRERPRTENQLEETSKRPRKKPSKSMPSITE